MRRRPPARRAPLDIFYQCVDTYRLGTRIKLGSKVVNYSFKCIANVRDIMAF